MTRVSHERIDSLIPNARAEPNPGLAGVATRELLAYLLDADHPWWRRETIARFWGGGLPATCVSPLLALAMDRSDTTEVRVAVLDALCSACRGADKARLVAWLQKHKPEPGYGLEDKLLRARAKLGDISVVRELARLAHDPWSHTRALGTDGLRALTTQPGHRAVLRELGCSSDEDAAANAKRPYLRMVGIRALEARGADLTPYLADPETSVARYVFDAFEREGVGRAPDLALLRELATSEATPQGTRCWARLALHSEGVSADATFAELTEPRVVVPGVPPQVRAAILAAHAPGERETDPRWLLEYALEHGDKPRPPWDDEPCPETIAASERFAEALKRRGLDAGPPVSSGQWRGQGGGTFFFLPVGAGDSRGQGGVWISTLGPFATSEADESPERTADLRAAAEDAGLLWIDDALCRTTFTGLCVYSFGDRDPMPVMDLLFYWQD